MWAVNWAAWAIATGSRRFMDSTVDIRAAAGTADVL